MIKRWALISRCGTYRYIARRVVGPGETALWIGVNPSTANASIDDASVRKLYGFGKILGIGTWLIANPFAYRSKNVKDLRNVPDPIGPNNDYYIRQMMQQADRVIIGWGGLAKLPARLRDRHKEILAIAAELNIPLYCWGTTADGQPRHPLMLAYSTELVPWR